MHSLVQQNSDRSQERKHCRLLQTEREQWRARFVDDGFSYRFWAVHY